MNVAGPGQLSIFGLTVPPKEEKPKEEKKV
jgi:hypothetical protein